MSHENSGEFSLDSNDSSKRPSDLENETRNDKFTPWQKAFLEEKFRVQERRKIAFEIDEEIEKIPDVENLTGLALSGGGIRSALFNDGFLQALSHRGLLRYVDYLCTVSGGGYIGGHLISCGVQKNNQSKTNPNMPAPAEQNQASSSSNSPSSKNTSGQSDVRCKNFHRDQRFWNLGKDPKTGRVDPDRLPNVGEYLSKSGSFLTRYFTTQIFVFFLYFGAVGIIATLAALFWRSFDHEDFRLLWSLYGLNEWGSEVSLAYYPTIWLISIWFLGSLLRLVSLVPACAVFFETRGRRIASTYILLMKFVGLGIGASILIGTAVVMGNGITNVSSSANGEFIHLNRFAEILALLAGVMQLLVFFGRDKLFRSEQAEAATWQKLLNKSLSIGVAFLLFFALVHWMARENISGFTVHRDPHLVRQDVTDWKGLANIVSDSQSRNETANLQNKLDWAQHHRHQITSRSSWHRFRPGASDPEPQSPFDSDTTNSESEFITSAQIHSTPANFFKLSALFLRNTLLGRNWFGSDDATEDADYPKKVTTVLGSTISLRKLQNQYLRKINVSLGTRDFTRHLVTIGQGANFETNLKTVTSLLSQAVKDESKRNKLASRILLAVKNENRLEPTDPVQKLDSDQPSKNPEEVALATLNRNLLELLHPNVIKDRRIASTPVVFQHDQETRRGWLAFFVALFLLGFLGTCNLNWQNSIFHYYRVRLNHNFLRGWYQGIDPASEPVSRRSKSSIALSQCDVTQVGLPYPLILGTWMQRLKNTLTYEPFLFTPNLVGITDRNKLIQQDPKESVERSDQYKLAGMNRELELGDAIAISGSAVTPLMTRNIWLSAMLDFFGVGLGQWLRRPMFKRTNNKRLLGYWTQVMRFIKKDDTFGFVADGGYQDVLGAYELLRRRCELIIVSDACCNTHRHELEALAKMLETANTNLGIKFFDLDHESPIDFGRLLKDENSNLPQNHILMRVRYPDDPGTSIQKDGLLIYSQMGITERDPIEIRQIKNKFPAFPDEPTSNQFYTKDQVAAYQKLGYYIGEKICSDLVRWEPEDIEQAKKHRQTFFSESSQSANREFYGNDPQSRMKQTSDADEIAAFRSNFNGETAVRKTPESEALAETGERERKKSQTQPSMRSMNKQPLFDVVLRRLLTGYRLACFEEDDYEQKDIFSEAVWDRNEWCFITFKECIESLRPMIARVAATQGYEAKLVAIRAVCLEWVRTYQTNADVCAVYRNLVFLDVNGGMLSTAGDESKSLRVVQLIERTLGFRKEGHELERAIISAAHFGAVAMACQQFHRGIPRAIFQIGGREKLMDLVASLFLTIKRRRSGKQLRPEMPPGRVPRSGQSEHWWQWLEKNCPELIELKTGVFNNAQVESTVSFTQVLILHLQSLQNWKTDDPPSTVLIRKRIYDAVTNFGIGDSDAIKGLDQIVADLFGRSKEGVSSN